MRSLSLSRLPLALLFAGALAHCEKASSRADGAGEGSSAASSSATAASSHATGGRTAAAGFSPASASASPLPSLPPAPDPTSLTREAHTRYGEDKDVAVESSFVLVSYERAPALFAAARSLLHRGVANYAQGWFGAMPSEPVYVLLFASAPAYDAYARANYDAPGSQLLGGYSRYRHEIVVDATAGERALPTMLHEALHPVLEQDWERAVGRGKEIPHWLNECVASVYESPRWDDAGGLHGAKWSLRYALLKGAIADPARKKHTQLDALFGMSDSEFLGMDPGEPVEALVRDPDGVQKRALARERLHYATARYLCLWLENREPSLLAPFYREVRDGFAKDPTGRAAFEKLVGKAPAAVQAEWESWVAVKP